MTSHHFEEKSEYVELVDQYALGVCVHTYTGVCISSKIFLFVSLFFFLKTYGT